MPLKDLLLLNLPNYCETLQSGKEVCFKPMIVSQEKSILISKQSENFKGIIKTIIEILQQCVDKDIDLNCMSIWDFENLFLLIRAKSIGEVEVFKIKCPETNEEVQIKINLLENIRLNKHTKKINNKIILDDLVLIFNSPTISNLLKFPNYIVSEKEYYAFIASCLKEIQTKKETINCKEIGLEETTEFIQSLTSQQFKKVVSYFDSLPNLEIKTKYQRSDGSEKELTIKGLKNYINFFFNHLSLYLFYQQNFEMKYNHKYNLNEIENMIPWERTVYLEQIRAELNENKQRLTNTTNL